MKKFQSILAQLGSEAIISEKEQIMLKGGTDPVPPDSTSTTPKDSTSTAAKDTTATAAKAGSTTGGTSTTTTYSYKATYNYNTTTKSSTYGIEIGGSYSVTKKK